MGARVGVLDGCYNFQTRAKLRTPAGHLFNLFNPFNSFNAFTGSEPAVHFQLNRLNRLVHLTPVILAEAKPPDLITDENNRAARLDPLQVEVIELFVELSRLLGQPRSLAEIYGLLFVSARPLAMDDLIERLRLSKGSASQGLKYLRNLGAVRTVYVAGDRRVHYEAVAELRKLAVRFLRDQIVPHLDNGQTRLDRIGSMVKQLSPGDRAQVIGRVKMLQSWERNGRRFLPMVLKMLGP